MTAPQHEFYPKPRTEALIIVFRIISRKWWDELQSLHGALPENRIEHVQYGIYVLVIGPGGGQWPAA